MKVITRKSKAADAAAGWHALYFRDEAWRWSNKVEPYNALVALGPDPDPDDVDRVIGNDSWTATYCHECGARGCTVVRVGEPPDYESQTACVCVACLRKALEEAEKA